MKGNPSKKEQIPHVQVCYVGYVQERQEKICNEMCFHKNCKVLRTQSQGKDVTLVQMFPA